MDTVPKSMRFNLATFVLKLTSPVPAVAVNVPAGEIIQPVPPMLLEPATVRFSAVVPVMLLFILTLPVELLSVIVPAVKSYPVVVEMLPIALIVRAVGVPATVLTARLVAP